MAKKVNKQEEDKPIVFYTQELKKSKTINEDTVKVITFTIVATILHQLVISSKLFLAMYEPTTNIIINIIDLIGNKYFKFSFFI